MVYRKKTKKTARRRYKAKPKNDFRSNFKCGDYHQNSLSGPLISSQSIIPSGTSYRAQALTEIVKGDLLTNRQTNLIYVNNVRMRLNLRNTHGYARGFRVVVVQLRGSVQSADTTAWSDLFINSTFNKYGPTGTDYDGTLRINQDEWNLVYDRKFQINGTTSGEAPSKFLNINIPIKKYVSYAYGSTSPRKGSMHIILMAYESPQVTPNAAPLEIEGEGQMHYYDINRVRKLP